MTISYKPKSIEITVNNNKYELDSEDIFFLLQIMDVNYFNGEIKLIEHKMREMNTQTQISILQRINKLKAIQYDCEQEDDNAQ